jgi:hypothetical protein
VVPSCSRFATTMMHVGLVAAAPAAVAECITATAMAGPVAVGAALSVHISAEH